jgi:hemolysin-activating ACP:hemolysin acyltransferase
MRVTMRAPMCRAERKGIGMSEHKLPGNLRRRYQKLGIVMELYAQAKRGRAFNGELPLSWIYPLVRLKQVSIMDDKEGLPCACIAWGFLTDATLARLGHSSDKAVHISEWNDGRDLCVLDAVSNIGLDLVMQWMLDHPLFADFERVIVLRARGGRARLTAKVWSRAHVTRIVGRMSVLRSYLEEQADMAMHA